MTRALPSGAARTWPRRPSAPRWSRRRRGAGRHAEASWPAAARGRASRRASRRTIASEGCRGAQPVCPACMRPSCSPQSCRRARSSMAGGGRSALSQGVRAWLLGRARSSLACAGQERPRDARERAGSAVASMPARPGAGPAEEARPAVVPYPRASAFRRVLRASREKMQRFSCSLRARASCCTLQDAGNRGANKKEIATVPSTRGSTRTIQ